MALTIAQRSTTHGALWAMIAVACFSVNDVLIKFLSGGYALHQIVFMRSFFGLFFLLVVVMSFSGKFADLRTGKLGQHILRGLCVVFANLCFFMGLASLPLAEAVALFFISPLVISVLSVCLLGETVGPRRWVAIAMGMLGVLIVLRPGTSAFQFASLLPLMAACGYAMLHIMTRRMGGTESAVALAVYIQITFFMTSGLIGLAIGNGAYSGWDHPSLEFFFRGWIWPGTFDLMLISVIGVTSAAGGFTISQAYRISEAALVAPFEYIAMPMAVFWGLVVFGDWPDAVAWFGITLILVSGLVLIWRESVAHKRTSTQDVATRL